MMKLALPRVGLAITVSLVASSCNHGKQSKGTAATASQTRPAASPSGSSAAPPSSQVRTSPSTTTSARPNATNTASSRPRERQIQCGPAVCLGAQECCVSSDTPLCVPQDTCVVVKPGGGIAAYVMHTCDGPEDCGRNQFCCEFYGARGGGFSCFHVGHPCDAVACHGDADCSGGSRCVPARDGIKKCVAL